MTEDITILLIATEPRTVELLSEAFEEMRELQYRRGWRGCAVSLAETVGEAELFLEVRGYDAIVLHLDGDLEPVGAYRHLLRLAPTTPVVIIAEPAAEHDAFDLVRMGAQDYLLVPDLDCLPLAHMLRCAIERQRHVEAQKKATLLDGLTGLYNDRGLDRFSEHYRRLAARHGLHLLRLEAGLPPTDDADLAALRASEAFQAALEPTDIIARTGPTSFSAVALVNGAEEAEATVSRLAALLPKGTEFHAATL